MSGTLHTKQVRRALRDRIAALTPTADYTTAVSLSDVTWHESPVPLAAAFAPPEPVQPLAFWVVDDTQGRLPSRTGRDSVFIESAVTVRFLFPSRPSGIMATAADDWDASADAAEHLLSHLVGTDWGEVVGLSIELGAQLMRRSYVGAGDVAILCEIFIIVRYELE